MNPVMTLTVDGTKVTAAGTVCVGEKIDVSVVGISESSLVPYIEGDIHRGPSIRFRIVDQQGRDLARFPSGGDDEWNVSGDVFTAYNMDLNTVQLRRAFEGVAYGDKLQFGIILDSSVDAAQYARGKAYIQQWAMSSMDDPKVLPDWHEVLYTLNNRIRLSAEHETSARESADSARASAASADSAAEQAEAKAMTAAEGAASASVASAEARTTLERVMASAADADLSRSEAAEEASRASESAEEAAASAARAAATLEECVKKSGATMSGRLTVPAITLDGRDLSSRIDNADANAIRESKDYTDAETQRAKDAEKILREELAKAVDERKDADDALAQGLGIRISGVVSSAERNAAAIAEEAERAKGAENALRIMISEISPAMLVPTEEDGVYEYTGAFADAETTEY